VLAAGQKKLVQIAISPRIVHDITLTCWTEGFLTGLLPDYMSILQFVPFFCCPFTEPHLPQPTCPHIRHIQRLVLAPHVLQRLVFALLLSMQ
jgi:hypothetical protein